MAKRWEHKSAMMPNALDEAMIELETLGEEGWELVQVCPPNSQRQCMVWLKREIAEEDYR